MPRTDDRLLVIGAGPMGLAAAYYAAKAGWKVEVLEAGDRPGGMAAHFDFNGLSLERFYHFCCRSDADTTALLAELGLPPARHALPHAVAVHDPCHLAHAQGVRDEVRTLLRQVPGLRLVDLEESDFCCGSAGTYNLMQPEIAGALRARKLENIARLKPDLIAAGNIGCMTQLSGDGTPVVHTVELLDWMAGGPKPAKLDAR